MNSSNPSRPVPVAIIGMGCMFPQAEDLSRFWANIRGRVDAISEVPDTHWSAEDYFDGDPKAADRTYAHRGGFLKPVDFAPMEFGIAPHAIEATDTAQLLALMVAKQALEDAGYGEGRTYDRDRASVILGVTGTLELVIPLGARLGHPIWKKALKDAGVDPATSEDVVRRISASYVGWQENSFPGLLGNVAAGRIANRLDLRGTNCVVDAACASSLGAVHLAAQELGSGRCDVAVTGGLDAFNDIFMYMCFSKTPALSPSGNARPFDANADGTILGEGIGILVLKRLDDAKRDGDRVYAVIRSIGTSSDGKGQAVYAPSAAGQAKALRATYALADVSPGTIELIEAHGTGTKVGDAVELSALSEVYRGGRDEGRWCAVGSVKSQVGHTKAAAGAAGLIKAALALHRRVLPPTIKVTDPIATLRDKSAPFYVNTEARPWLPSVGHPRRAAVSAFGFGGSNFHCLLEEADASDGRVDWDGDVQIIAYSGSTVRELEAGLDRLEACGDWGAIRGEAASSRAAFRASDDRRIVLVLERGSSDTAAIVREARERLAGSGSGVPPDAGKRVTAKASGGAVARVAVGAGPRPGKLAMLFPGQGSQYVGMSRELACLFPRMRSALDMANEAGGQASEARLSDLIYPGAAFSDTERAEQEQALRDTRHAQPAIGAVSLGLLRILTDFGIDCELAGGHSFGELTALLAAGTIDDAAFATLARTRGELMGEMSTRGGNGGGAMLAVFGSPAEILPVLHGNALDLVIANHNAPKQCVLSGPTEEIERARELFARAKLTTRALAVSAAFHSRFVAEARAPFLRALESVPTSSPRFPVFSNQTAESYPADACAIRELLAGQLARPVKFVEQVEAMYGAGARTFLEVGPDAKLSGLVRSILGSREHVTLAVDASRGEAGNLVDLASTLASLAALGYAVELDRWDPCPASSGPSAVKKPGLTVKICGANARPAPVGGAVTAAAKPRPIDRTTEISFASEVVSAPAPLLPSESRITATFGPRQPATPAETDWTMNSHSPERISLHHTNGHATTSSNGHAERPRHPSTEPPPAPAVPSGAGLISGVMNDALSRTRESLKALQQLAERTAELHRQFLEGQEKTQATFLHLLEEQLRLTRAGGAAYRATTGHDAPGTVNHDRARPEYRNGDAAGQPAGHLVPPVKKSHRNGDGAGNTNGTGAVESPAHFHDSARPEPVAEGWRRVEPEVSPAKPVATVVQQPAAVRAESIAADSSPVAATSDALAATAEIVLEVISEKTGYPAEALELDQQLDADLGIDSIKRVEIFSALQDRVAGLRPLGPEELASLRTLRAIVEFLAAVPAAAVAAASVPAAVSSPAPISSAPSAPSVDTGRRARLTETLLETVAEKTGYPSEMLELEMRLDADLGIDSIKRVEIFSALQDRIDGAPAVGPEMIGRLTTLGEVVAFLEGNGGAVSAAVAAAEPARGGVVAAASNDEQAAVARILLETVAEKTGYPSEMLELEMRLDADLGIDSIKRVEIFSALQDRLPGANAIGPDQIGTLATLGDIVAFLSRTAVPSPLPLSLKSAPVATGAPHGAIAARNGHLDVVGLAKGELAPPTGHWLSLQELRVVRLASQGGGEANRFPAGGLIWVTDDGSALAGLVAGELRGRGFDARVIRTSDATTAVAERDRPCGLVLLSTQTGTPKSSVLEAFRVVRAAGPWLQKAGQNAGASLVTVARLDGTFGVGGGLAGMARPDSGVLAGIAKTAGHEWPLVDCKALDLDARFDDPDRGAKWIVEELLHQGPSEVGLSARGRVGLELVRLESERGAVSKRPRLRAGDVVVVSGGARGVTAEVAVAIAERYQCTMVVLGRTAEPGEEIPELAACGDETELRRVLMRVGGSGASPQVIGRQAKEVLAHREIRRNLARIKATGASVAYRQVDVRDRAAVAGIIGGVEEQFGPVRGLVHGAGVLADRKILDQTDEQFTSVYETKVDGLENLFRAIDPSGLAVLVLFSSSTARFGRVGQVAYAAANEYLNKWAQKQAVSLPECRVVSLNWGPWAGGMVTDGLKKLFESEGIGLIELASGAKVVLDEIERERSRPVEIVVLGELTTGRATGKPAPRDDAGGSRLNSSHADWAAKTAHEPKLDAVIRKSVSVKSVPVLKDHVINGHAVVPMALVMEWLSEAAIQRNPGLALVGLKDCRLFKGVTLEGTERVELALAVGRAVREGSAFIVSVELRGELANGRAVSHARADVMLGDRHANGERRIEEPRVDRSSVPMESIYRDVLFHGPGLQAIDRVLGCNSDGIAGVVASGAKVSDWLDRPTRNEWLTDPLAIDAAFQLMIVWTRQELGTNSLPVGMAGYQQFSRRFPNGGVRIVARVIRTDGSRVTADLEFVDQAGKLVARIEGYESVCDASLNDSFRRNRLSAAALIMATS